MTEAKSERIIYLLDNEGCTPCEQIKQRLAAEIEKGSVKVLQLTSDEALALLDSINPEQVPLPSMIIKEGDRTRLCDICDDDEVTLVKCGEETIAVREIPPTEGGRVAEITLEQAEKLAAEKAIEEVRKRWPSTEKK